MKPRIWIALAAAMVAAGASLVTGCGGEGVSVAAAPVELTITDATVPAIATAGQPVTYSATVRLSTTGQKFVRFGFGRAGHPFTVTAFGQQGGGATTERTEAHDGTIIFPSPGTYNVVFANSDPEITRTVTVTAP